MNQQELQEPRFVDSAHYESHHGGWTLIKVLLRAFSMQSMVEDDVKLRTFVYTLTGLIDYKRLHNRLYKVIKRYTRLSGYKPYKVT
jgi:hypothetical protein